MLASARRSLWLVQCGLIVGLLAGGCGSSKSEAQSKKGEGLPQRYAPLPPRENVPGFMKGTIYEYIELQNKDPYPVSGYGIVVGLAGTADNTGTPLAVRGYMVDEMVRHGFGAPDERMRKFQPEGMLRDPRIAIAEVYALLPPGARSGQRIDAYVRAVEGSQTKSLARGTLYQSNLFINGVDPLNPKGRVNVYAKVKGPVFVNPGYAISGPSTQPAVQASLRGGTVMHGGIVMADRPLWIRVRTPQLSIGRAIEARIDQRFGDEATARTQDEGIVWVFVPKSFNGDWQHFMGVVSHLYMDPGVAIMKARMLVEEAQKPDAALLDISYCWEAIGHDVVPFIQPLYAHKSPEVAYSAARAGAFIGDVVAHEALLEMAKTEGHAFQLNAAKTLGALASSPGLDRTMRQLLASKNALVRVEAYQALVAQESPLVVSRQVRESFILDRVACDGPPLIYATRMGIPRIAMIGQDLSLKTPVMFRAMDGKLTLTTPAEGGELVTVFDRTVDVKGVSGQSRPDLYELVYRLGGGSEDGFGFVYSELVGILQSLSEGRHVSAAFVLQDPPALQDVLEEAPPLVEPDGRPQDQAAGHVGPGSAALSAQQPGSR